MFSLLRPSLLIAASLPAAAQAQQGGAVVERIALAMGTSLRRGETQRLGEIRFLAELLGSPPL